MSSIRKRGKKEEGRREKERCRTEGGREGDIQLPQESQEVSKVACMSGRPRVVLRRRNTAVGLCSTRDMLGTTHRCSDRTGKLRHQSHDTRKNNQRCCVVMGKRGPGERVTFGV